MFLTYSVLGQGKLQYTIVHTASLGTETALRFSIKLKMINSLLNYTAYTVLDCYV